MGRGVDARAKTEAGKRGKKVEKATDRRVGG
jgi:hypothetical protein